MKAPSTEMAQDGCLQVGNNVDHYYHSQVQLITAQSAAACPLGDIYPKAGKSFSPRAQA